MKVTIYSDGSSRGNPGPGGFGTILHYVDRAGTLHEATISEGYRLTTNNRMELLGAISGLEALNRPCQVEIISDSKYLTDAFNQGWIYSWQKKNWHKSDNSVVLNVDLWERLLKAMEGHEVIYTWIKGHAGHEENERCDKMAVESAGKEDLKLDEIYEMTKGEQ